jgi:murein DD-endopeptidase MepM/ murein hydrolase activator NlpD
MRKLFFGLILILEFNSLFSQNYPQGYFRNPLDIPMQLVANFGEIRTNHWHMGLDIRTHQRVNLPVHAAADGYVSRVSVEPGGFGQAIYITHPNGYTTLYGHLNAFFPALAQYIKSQQYAAESWNINLNIPEGMFPVHKGDYIALSGSTGASEGPHVHFEIRDTKTGKCLNPLLFQFPIADAIPPAIYRVAMYDRNRSVYAQSPQFISTGNANVIKTGSDKISFAIAATDRFSGSANQNGIYAAKTFIDGDFVSGFTLDKIDYDETRYINAQIDFRYKNSGGGNIQHLSPLPGAKNVAYEIANTDGLIHLNDLKQHHITIEVKDANGNKTEKNFWVQYDPGIATENKFNNNPDRFLPNNVNVFENNVFELFTSEYSIYDTVNVVFNSVNETGDAISPLFNFLSDAIPAHDSITVRIKPSVDISESERNRIVIKNISGKKTFVSKATWQNGWVAAKFRQFGSFRAFIDNEAPTVNAPALNLAKASRIAFTPHDNFNSIRKFRAELDGHWLKFTNDKGKTWIYTFDEHFPRGEHELKVTIEDEAGNVLTRTWSVHR